MVFKGEDTIPPKSMCCTCLGEHHGPAIKQQHLQVTRIVARAAINDGIDAVMIFPHFAADLHFSAAYTQHETRWCLIEIKGIACGGIELRHDVFSRAETLNMALMYHKYCMNKQYFRAVVFYAGRLEHPAVMRLKRMNYKDQAVGAAAAPSLSCSTMRLMPAC